MKKQRRDLSFYENYVWLIEKHIEDKQWSGTGTTRTKLLPSKPKWKLQNDRVCTVNRVNISFQEGTQLPYIRIICPCNVYPLASHFYIVNNNEKFRSFKSKENIHKKEVGPCRGFGY